jgi:hypothetical protein
VTKERTGTKDFGIFCICFGICSLVHFTRYPLLVLRPHTLYPKRIGFPLMNCLQEWRPKHFDHRFVVIQFAFRNVMLMLERLYSRNQVEHTNTVLSTELFTNKIVSDKMDPGADCFRYRFPNVPTHLVFRPTARYLLVSPRSHGWSRTPPSDRARALSSLIC